MANLDAGLKRTFVLDAPAPAPKSLGGGKAKSISEMVEALQARVPDSVLALHTEGKGDPFVYVAPGKIVDVLRFLRDDPNFTCTNLHVISAVDYLQKDASEGATPIEPRIEVVYVVASLEHKHQFMIKVKLPREAPQIDSVTVLYRVANFHERECYDMVGVVFKGHPDLRRILCPDDWVGHPLRKDYIFPEEYNGMKVPL